MDINKLKANIEKAEEKVEKCKGTIARHEGQLNKKLAAIAKHGITLENMIEKKWKGGTAGTGSSEFYWDIVQIEQKQDDIKGATRKLQDSEKVLNNWQAKFDIEIEKERFLNDQAPAVIVEFLNQWKERVRGWYIKAHEKYLELDELLEVKKEEAKARFLAENPNGRTWGREWDAFMKSDKEVKSISVSILALGGLVAKMASYRHEDERLAWLEKILEEERRAKLFDLIRRINEIVGTITDAAYLRISEKGNLDGFIVGEKGKAQVLTIGAGGYNVQVFHYRTLVHEIK
ncbi:hypothetical protein M5X17_31185 [Paenibacillus alvei]|uniref:hypothetical protein n=1 Tax=Paenibacillus alvei TaxID=44250 RepID=UPI0022803AAB|nr:hypothetical protein [Paenibacillus alvei]MCY9738158.1 hypothetical protein [Paenibacillus alvei]